MPETDSTLYWPAPLAQAPVRASIVVPGSKSLTNRYLVLAALAAAHGGQARIENPLESRDSQLMLQALTALGMEITAENHAIIVRRRPGWEPAQHPVHIDCGLAGTVMRFVPVLAAAFGGDYIFDGDAGARIRPMQQLLYALTQQGVEITGLDSNHQPLPGPASTLPFRLRSTGTLPGGEISLDSSATSQYISALLFLGTCCATDLQITHTGTGLPSPDHIAMTTTLLAEHGVSVHSQERKWRISPHTLGSFTAVVEPDLSNAGPFLAAAVVTGGEVQVPFWPARTTQVGDQWRQLLPRFGAEVRYEVDQPSSTDATGQNDAAATRGTLIVTGPQPAPGEAFPRFPGAGEIADSSELAPTLAGLAALAQTPTTLSGIGHLRGHETDRLAALRQEITALGGAVEETADGLIITPQPLHGGRFATYHDHRMATTAALLGLVVDGVEVENIATTGKTLPDFVGMWTQLLAGAS